MPPWQHHRLVTPRPLHSRWFRRRITIIVGIAAGTGLVYASMADLVGAMAVGDATVRVIFVRIVGDGVALVFGGACGGTGVEY
jgi:hypothetical protein